MKNEAKIAGRVVSNVNLEYDKIVRQVRGQMVEFEKQLLKHGMMQGRGVNQTKWDYVEALELVRERLDDMMRELGNTKYES